MAETTIDVRGSHTVTVAPDRATVHGRVALDGSDAGVVRQAVAHAADAVRATVEPLHDAARGPVTTYAFHQVRLGSERPWTQDGAQLALVHRAEIAFTVTFSDVDAVAAWVDRNRAVSELHLHHIAWDLDPSRRTGVERAARREALRDAVLRAQDYADAIGLRAVRPVRVSDPGVRPAPLPVAKRAFAAAAMAEDAAPELQLTPDDLEITVEVEATFVAEA